MNKKMFWKIYLFTFLFIAIMGYVSEGLGNTMAIINLIVSLPALMALFGWAYRKKFLNATVWKVYSIGFFSFDLIFNLILNEFDPYALIGIIIAFPLYIAVFLYAFKFFGTSK